MLSKIKKRKTKPELFTFVYMIAFFESNPLAQTNECSYLKKNICSSSITINPEPIVGTLGVRQEYTIDGTPVHCIYFFGRLEEN